MLVLSHLPEQLAFWSCNQLYWCLILFLSLDVLIHVVYGHMHNCAIDYNVPDYSRMITNSLDGTINSINRTLEKWHVKKSNPRVWNHHIRQNYSFRHLLSNKWKYIYILKKRRKKMMSSTSKILLSAVAVYRRWRPSAVEEGVSEKAHFFSSTSQFALLHSALTAVALISP